MKQDTVMLTKSSIISLRAETHKISIRGTSVVNRPVGETSGICCTNISIAYNPHIKLQNLQRHVTILYL